VAATAIVVPFRAVPAVVDRRRRELTTDGADGMPPHITLISPFVDDADLTEADVDRLRGVLAASAPFDVTLARFARFDAQPPVLYLEPEPPEPFLAMITAIEQAFPAFPPFGGVHETVIPHLTVAYSDDPAALGAVEAEVGRHLPVHARVTEVVVMEHRADNWRPREHITLDAPQGV
jgi:2'-5' RNA ligase